MKQCHKLALCSALVLSSAGVAHAQTTVEIDMSSVLKGRAVTTLTNGVIVPWDTSFDGYDGYATQSAALKLGTKDPLGLPDDGKFPAVSGVHPAVQLNFSNSTDAKSPQVVTLSTSLSFSVPSGHYSNLWVYVMSASGGSKLSASVTYDTGAPTVTTINDPDWAAPLGSKSSDAFDIASNLGKWTKEGNEVEHRNHYIHAFDVKPDASRSVTKVMVEKVSGGQCTFWGATGVTTGGSVPAGVGGAGAGGNTGSGGMSGTGATAGVGGVSGANGASGANGVSAGAGASAVAGNSGTVAGSSGAGSPSASGQAGSSSGSGGSGGSGSTAPSTPAPTGGDGAPGCHFGPGSKGAAPLLLCGLAALGVAMSRRRRHARSMLRGQ